MLSRNQARTWCLHFGARSAATPGEWGIGIVLHPADHLYSEQENTGENRHDNRSQEGEPHRGPPSIERLRSRLMVGRVKNPSGSIPFEIPT
jgi:hypothetical protein